MQTVRIPRDQGIDMSARSPSATAPTARAPATATQPTSAGPLSLTPPVATAPAARTRNYAVASATPSVPSASAGVSGYFIQVLAQDSQAQAQSSFRSLQARYPNQLGGLQPTIRRKEVRGNIKYGAQVGPYASREEAMNLCDNLKAAGGSCFVVR